MAKGKADRDRTRTWICWIARAWSLPLIGGALLVLAGYAWNWVTGGVADPYAVEDYPFIEALPPILILLSIAGLGVAWRWERLGGSIAVVLQLATLLLLFVQSPIARDFPRFAIPYIVSLIVATPGVLFLICSWRAK